MAEYLPFIIYFGIGAFVGVAVFLANYREWRWDAFSIVISLFAGLAWPLTMFVLVVAFIARMAVGR